MHLHLPGNLSPIVPLFAGLILFTSFRLCLKHKKSDKQRSRRFRLTGARIGNALQTLHIFVDPGVRYVSTEELYANAEDDEDDPADPTVHFEHQLRRIRLGEQIDRLTIRMREKE